MNLTERQWRVLLALGDTLIPRDAFPSASEAGLRAFLERIQADLGDSTIERLRAGIDVLVMLDFDLLSAERQRDVVEQLQADDPPAPWPERSSRWLRTMLALVEQSYYADADAGRVSWPMVGFDPAPKRPLPSIDSTPLQSRASRRNTRRVRRRRGGCGRGRRCRCTGVVAGGPRCSVDRTRRVIAPCRCWSGSFAQSQFSVVWTQHRAAGGTSTRVRRGARRAGSAPA